MCFAEKKVGRRAFSLAAAVGALCLALSLSWGTDAQAAAGEFGSNRYTRPMAQSRPQQGYDLTGYTLLLENDVLAVYWRPQVGGLRVMDQRSGYVWGTMAEDKPENLNQKWSAIANSMVVIEAFDGEGKTVRAGAAEENLRCEASGNRIQVRAEWPEWQIGFGFSLELEENGLTFSLEDETIREEGAYRLANVTFAPFFGAVWGDSLPGYVFVPDGCGALIRFLSPRQYLTGYAKRIYGEDLGIDAINSSFVGAADTVTPEQPATLPLFGMVHGEGQNAYLAVADRGEEYGTIVAEPAGLVCDYTRANIRFVYRQLYEQPVSRVGVGVQTVQPRRNEVNPGITYYFLTGEEAGYCGMAKTYRSLLEGQGVLSGGGLAGDVPVRLDFLAADVEKRFFGTSVLIATSEELMERAAEELRSFGIKGLQLGLLGWQKGGLNGCDKTAAAKRTVYGKLSSLEGGEKKWLALSPFSAVEGQFDKRSEGAISLSQELIVKKVTDRAGEEEDWPGNICYLKPDKALEAMLNQTEELVPEGWGQLLLQDMNLLYGEYLTGREKSRSEVLAGIQETVNAVSQQCEGLLLTRPNSYLFGAMDGYDQIPMTNSQFLYETDTVPFLQMVLSGSVELYAPYGNLNFYSVSDVLKMADYNTSPTWLLTEVDNYELRNTASAKLFSTRYEDWKERIRETCLVVCEILEQTRGQRFLNRRVPEDGVVVNEYEKGVVYVNYHATVKRVDGMELPGESAVYVERLNEDGN